MKKLVKYQLLLGFIFLISNSFAQLNKAYFFYQGQKLISQGKFKESIGYLNTLINADSTLYEGWFLRGVAKYYLQDYHGAIADFSTSIRFNPVMVQAYHYRANVENQLSMFGEALKDLDFAIAIKPNNPDFLFSRGVTFFQLHQFTKAADDFSRVIRLTPNNPDAWLNRATSKLFLGDTIGSIEDFGNAIKYNPFYSDSYARRGRVFFEQRKFALALFDLDKAIQLDSTSTFNFFSRALIRNSMGNIKGAIADFDRVLIMDPANSLSLYNRALIKSQIGDLSSALYDYNQLVRLNPENVIAYYNRASVLIELKRYNDAIADYTKAIELFPDFANAYLNRSFSKQRIGDLKGAEQDYTIANQKVRKYKSSSQDAYLAMADTSQKFNKLLSFNTDFNSGKFNMQSLDEYSISSGFLPFFYVSIIPKSDPDGFEDNEKKVLDDFNQNLIKGFRFKFTNKQGAFKPTDSLLINRNEGLAHFLAAINFSALKKFNLAVSEYEQTLKFLADNPLIKLNLAVEKIEMARYIQQFDYGVGTVSLGRNMFINESANKSTNINYNEGLAILKELEGLEPELSVIPYNIGNTYFLMEELESAANAYSRAIQINPKFVEAYYNRGLALLIKGEKIKGCIDISKAGELGLPQSYTLIQRYCK